MKFALLTQAEYENLSHSSDHGSFWTEREICAHQVDRNRKLGDPGGSKYNYGTHLTMFVISRMEII